MKALISVKNIVGITLFLTVLGYAIYSCEGPQPPVIEHKIDTVFQEVKVEVPKYIPKWRTKIDTIEVHDSIKSEPVDTIAILADYYAHYQTIDTLNIPYPDSINRSFGYGIITDVVTRNTISSRSVVWNYSIPTVTHTITIHPKPKAEFYVGAMANVNRVQILSAISGALLYKTKKDRIYIANIGVANNGMGMQPFLGGGVVWKVNIKNPFKPQLPLPALP